MIGALPDSLEVNGKEYRIRTDYRDVLTILTAFDDPDLEPGEKVFVCLYILYPDFGDIPQEDLEEAYQQAARFIDCGAEMRDEAKRNPRLVDWEQDERILFPAINAVAGREVRGQEYMHWWTFMGYFMEIHEGTYAQVLQLRQKRAKGKKLEKWEQEFWRTNKDICKIRKKLSQEEKAEQEFLKDLLGG